MTDQGLIPVVYSLTGLVFVETVFFLYVINVLLNKLMSRDFLEYQKGKGLSKKQKEVIVSSDEPATEGFGRLADLR